MIELTFSVYKMSRKLFFFQLQLNSIQKILFINHNNFKKF